MRIFSLYWQILRQKTGQILSYVVIFVFIFLLTISSAKVNTDTTAIKLPQARLAVLDQDQSLLAQALTSFLTKQGQLVDLKLTLTGEDKVDRELIQDQIFNGFCDYVVLIPQGFGQKLNSPDLNLDLGGTTDTGMLPFHDLKTDAKTSLPEVDLRTYSSPDQNMDYGLVHSIENFLSTWNSFRISYGGQVPEKELTSVLTDIAEITNKKVEGRVIGQANLAESNKLSGLYFYFNFLNYVILATGFIIIGQPLTSLERPALKKRDEVSGYSSYKRSRQIMLAAYLAMLALWLLLCLVLFIRTKLGHPITFDRVEGLILLSNFIHLLACSSLIFMVCSLVSNKEMINLMSTVFSLFIAFSSGIFVPAELLWQPFHQVSAIFPTYWDIGVREEIVKLALAEGPSFSLSSKIYWGLALMLTMAACYFVITLVIRRFRSVAYE